MADLGLDFSSILGGADLPAAVPPPASSGFADILGDIGGIAADVEKGASITGVTSTALQSGLGAFGLTASPGKSLAARMFTGLPWWVYAAVGLVLFLLLRKLF